MIVQETRAGLSGSTRIRWLVSCKHYAHSGKSINDSDEPNILDRVSVHSCDGFLGFYSTLPATSLGAIIQGLKSKIQVQSFDKEQIEKNLFETPQGLKLASRYFPASFENYKVENPKPAKIFADELSINCEYCNKNLLEEKKGIFVLLRKFSDFNSTVYQRKPYENAYFSCKGKCDIILKNRYFQNEVYLDQWTDISDFLSPTGYIRKVMAWLNSLNIDNDKVEPKAFEKVKKLLLNSFPHISREQTTEEKDRIRYYLENGIGDYL